MRTPQRRQVRNTGAISINPQVQKIILQQKQEVLFMSNLRPTLQTKLTVILWIGVFNLLAVYGYLAIHQLREQVVLELTSKGEALAVAGAIGIQVLAEQHIKNGVALSDGTFLSGPELEAALFDDTLTPLPGSAEAVNRRGYGPDQTVTRFDGTVISRQDYEIGRASCRERV